MKLGDYNQSKVLYIRFCRKFLSAPKWNKFYPVTLSCLSGTLHYIILMQLVEDRYSNVLYIGVCKMVAFTQNHGKLGKNDPKNDP